MFGHASAKDGLFNLAIIAIVLFACITHHSAVTLPGYTARGNRLTNLRFAPVATWYVFALGLPALAIGLAATSLLRDLSRWGNALSTLVWSVLCVLVTGRVVRLLDDWGSDRVGTALRFYRAPLYYSALSLALVVAPVFFEARYEGTAGSSAKDAYPSGAEIEPIAISFSCAGLCLSVGPWLACIFLRVRHRFVPPPPVTRPVGPTGFIQWAQSRLRTLVIVSGLAATISALPYLYAWWTDPAYADLRSRIDQINTGLDVVGGIPRTDRDSAASPRKMTNSIGMKLVLIPAGEFFMGSDGTDPEAGNQEVVFDEFGRKQKHRVQITRRFYLGETEVTCGQFRRFVDEARYQTEAEKVVRGSDTWKNPGFEQSDEHPVVNVTWNDAVAFCEWLSKKEGRTYRLPTEAEWEYACRAGTLTRYYFGNDPDRLGAYAWYHVNSGGKPHPVRQKYSNAWGLFDMHGNVWEWCRDEFAADYYRRSPPVDPHGPDGESALRVWRGGSWLSLAPEVRAATRFGRPPGDRSFAVGFRCGEFSSDR
jgi:formylglycine-generating enzyme required for sulfatase activity